MSKRKKWLLCFILAIVTVAIIILIQTRGSFDFSNINIVALLGALLILTLLFRWICLFFIDSRGYAKQIRENNEKGEGVEFQVLDGIPNMKRDTHVQLFFEEKTLLIKAKYEEQTARLEYSQIIDAHLYTETEIIKKQRNPGSRALWGGILGGETGAIVGGFSGLQTKEKVTEKKYLIILYTSDGTDNRLVFSITHASLNVGRERVVARLREKAGLQKEVTPKMESSTDFNL